MAKSFGSKSGAGANVSEQMLRSLGVQPVPQLDMPSDTLVPPMSAEEEYFQGTPEMVSSLPTLEQPTTTQPEQPSIPTPFETEMQTALDQRTDLRPAIRSRLAASTPEGTPQVLPTVEGGTQTEEQAAETLRFETEQMQQRLPEENTYDYRNMQTVSDARRNITSSDSQSTLQLFAVDSYETMSHYNTRIANPSVANVVNEAPPTNQTSISFLANQANTDERTVLNAYVEESMRLGRQLFRQRVEPDAEADRTNITAQNIDEMIDNIVDEDYDIENPVAYQSPMKLKDYKRSLGQSFIQNIKNKTDNTSMPLNSIDPIAIGDILFKTQLDNDYVNVVPDPKTGEDAVILSENGRKVNNKTYKITHRQDIDIRGGGTYTPAPYIEQEGKRQLYHWAQPLNKYRKQTYGRYKGKDSVQFSELRAAVRGNAIRGRSYYTTTPNKLGTLGLLAALTFNTNTVYSTKAADLLNLGQKKINKMIDRGHKKEIINRDLQNEAQTWLTTSLIYMNDFLNGRPATVYSRVDDYNGRAYVEDHYRGGQGNYAARSIFANAKRYPIVIDPNSPVINAIKNNNMEVTASKAAKDLFANYETKLNPETQILFSLYFQQAVLNPQIDPEEQTFEAVIRALDINNLRKWARIGQTIRNIQKEIGVINQDGSLNQEKFQQLLPAHTQAGIIRTDPETGLPYPAHIQEIPSLNPEHPNHQATIEALDYVFSRGAEHKNFGEVFGALEDATRFVESIDSGKPYIAEAIGSQDMKMAGITIVSLALGDVSTAARSGIGWELIENAPENVRQGINMADNNRVAFTGKLIRDVLNSPILSSRAVRNVASEDQELVLSIWKNTLQELSPNTKEGKKFASALAKTPMMTTSYGRPAKTHWDTMVPFLKKPAAAPLKEALSPFYKRDDGSLNLDAMAKDLANLIEQTLYLKDAREVDKFMKEYVNFLGLYGMTPSYKGFFGNDWELGITHNVEGEPVAYIQTDTGETVLRVVSSQLDFGAAKEPSEVTYYDEELGKRVTQVYIPARYSGVALQSLAQMGQTAEAEAMLALINTVNPDMSNTEFTVDVFDNIMSDMNGLAKYYAAANDPNPNTIFNKVLNYDRVGALVDGYRLKRADAFEKIKKLVKEDRMMDIGTRGEFSGIMHQGDNAYDTIQKILKDGNGSVNPKDQYEYDRSSELLRIFKEMGYKTPDERGNNSEHLLISPKDFLTKTVDVTVFEGSKKTVKPNVRLFNAFAVFHGLETTAAKVRSKAEVKGIYENKRNKAAQKMSKLTQQHLFMTPGL